MKNFRRITATLLCVLMLFSAISVSVSAAVKPGKPTSFTAGSVKANSVTLSWKAGSNANAYRIYQKVNGKWVTYKEVAATSYTVTGLNAQSTYEFGVRSLRKQAGKATVTSDGYCTLKVKTANLVATKLSATATVNSVKLKWDTVPGAAGYIVYQYISGKWKAIGTPASTKKEGTVKNLTHNTTYRFAIRAYVKINGSVVLGPASNQLSIKTPDRNKSKLTCDAVNASAARLNWTKAVDATGYRIYYYNNGTWKTVKTIMSGKTLTHIVTGLASDTKYNFRVRPFKKVGSSVKWYDWSNTCTVISNPSSKDLKVYRTDKLKNTFNAQNYTFSYKISNKKYGSIPVTIAKAGESYYLSSKVNELEYSLLKNSDGAFIIINERAVYIKVPELLSGAFDLSAAANELLPGEKWSARVTIESFNGKVAVCETFVNPLKTATVKYYYKAGELLGINEYGLGGTLAESATVTSIKNSSTASLFTVPAGYGNILYPGYQESEPEVDPAFAESIL